MTERAGDRGGRLLACLGLLALALACAPAVARADGRGPSCDARPTGVQTEDYFLHFRVPRGLMPDPQFDSQPAKLHVHRVRPVWAHGRCPGVSAKAIVLIHGRAITGPPVFDLRDPVDGSGDLSIQETLARAGIDTFDPDLLGYGLSTRFSLDDPGNASLRSAVGGACPFPEGCDTTIPPWNSLDGQGSFLLTNPLGGVRRPHSSPYRFARTDVWVRDIRQVIDDAVARAHPAGGKVALLGYSAGAQRVGRTLYADNPVLPGAQGAIAKISRVVFVSPLFGGTTEETPPPTGYPSYPLAVSGISDSTGGYVMPAGRSDACTGHVIPGVPEQEWKQVMALDPLGHSWGGTDPAHTDGVNRSPTFSGYGWNADVAAQITKPTLVIQGFEDLGVPGGVANSSAIYNALPASLANKVLVRIQCASHSLPLEGCSGLRCTPAAGTPYGAKPGDAWAGPHATLTAALIEWLDEGTFDGAQQGRFVVDESGVAHPDP